MVTFQVWNYFNVLQLWEGELCEKDQSAWLEDARLAKSKCSIIGSFELKLDTVDEERCMCCGVRDEK